MKWINNIVLAGALILPVVFNSAAVQAAEAQSKQILTEQQANTDNQAIAAIKSRLLTMLGPEAVQANIKASEVDGLYQIQLGMSIAYMSEDGQFLLNGNLIDLQSGQNITKNSQMKIRRSLMAQLDERSMIIYPGAKDKPQHTITVFTDIDCPYCEKFHKQVPKLNKAGVTVRYLSFPRSGPDSPSYDKAISVWCSKDQLKVMNDAMAGMEPQKQQCQHPIDKHLNWAQRFEVNGTPNILLENGDILPGFVPAGKLLALLRQQ